MRVLWVSIVVVLLDQVSKVTVVQMMHRGESIPLVGDWLKFTFTENPGMAFGIAVFPRETTAVFSIIVTVVVLWYLYSVRSGYMPYLTSLALILGGAVGNIIDRAFYGLILNYGDLFEGKVVDFIHVDVWRGYLPEAIPFIGGAYLPLFPIWNVADMAIVVGVVGILVFQRRFHRRAFEEPARERERLRELERERGEAHAQPAGTAGGMTQTAGAEGPSTPTASSKQSSTAPEAAIADGDTRREGTDDGARDGEGRHAAEPSAEEVEANDGSFTPPEEDRS